MTVYTPRSYDDRVAVAWKEFMYSGGDGTFRPPERTPEERRQRKIGDAERIAVAVFTHLVREGNFPPVCHLYKWVKLIIRWPGYAEPFWRYLERKAPDVGPRGLHDLGPLIDDLDDGKPSCLDVNLDHVGRVWANFSAWQARAIYHLASELVDHRRWGEPDTDRTAEMVRGMFTVTTSLAAAVVEYHESVCNIYAMQLAWERGDCNAGRR